MQTLKAEPIAKAAMLIRKPIAAVFEAFLDPSITSHFWFTKGSGRLEVGDRVQWDWDMYDHTVSVEVKAIENNKRILIEWGNYGDRTSVEWVFTPHEGNATYVEVTNRGFRGDGDKVVNDALESKGGFTLVLAGAKVWLEHGVVPTFVADAFPRGLAEH